MGENVKFGNDQAVLQHFQGMRQELSQIWAKIGELDMERSEHSLVIKAIEPLDKDRKCFRLIGGVLVERTVGEVLPAVARNRDGLSAVIEKLTEQLEKKKNEITAFQQQYNIRPKGEEQPQEQKPAEKAASSGVLVG
mmetsp:Transcript_37641/g.45400  ORF Transcript_37641/g.45400 Transcript_37641/m.45400 type:complete len:137 (-) Transcript_37641:421-831(-)|eukprot:CAMPEP_0197847972 /NCGR_PEP_ID=MMETSP1438-20131217/7657_1 /TAXON_ID=1461541 /ORGANISM="Pterosperma sp., Strain CCMP1384" /LENGTH=136 /DNA_ID=CAMNT_0043460069 /DNA_START=158 /DNA_END=568 /DNA_ORIENTATION=+